jgi:hypothetical protein
MACLFFLIDLKPLGKHCSLGEPVVGNGIILSFISAQFLHSFAIQGTHAPVEFGAAWSRGHYRHREGKLFSRCHRHVSMPIFMQDEVLHVPVPFIRKRLRSACIPHQCRKEWEIGERNIFFDYVVETPQRSCGVSRNDRIVNFL